MITMIRVMMRAAFKQPSRQYKFELWQREQAKWYKRHASVGNGPRDLNNKQKYFGNGNDRLF